jgi:DNA-directed RNA polymerase sigma subunit (sigma70/sigma32)
VVNSHYGLDGSPPRSMKELRHDLGLSKAEVRDTLAGGLAKLRARLSD